MLLPAWARKLLALLAIRKGSIRDEAIAYQRYGSVPAAGVVSGGISVTDARTANPAGTASACGSLPLGRRYLLSLSTLSIFGPRCRNPAPGMCANSTRSPG